MACELVTVLAGSSLSLLFFSHLFFLSFILFFLSLFLSVPVSLSLLIVSRLLKHVILYHNYWYQYLFPYHFDLSRNFNTPNTPYHYFTTIEINRMIWTYAKLKDIQWVIINRQRQPLLFLAPVWKEEIARELFILERLWALKTIRFTNIL